MSTIPAKYLLPITALASLAADIAHAEPGNPLTDRFSVSLGTFLLGTSTRLRVDGTAGNGTELNAERDLGLHDSNRLRADLYWRFRKRHKLRALYFDTERSAQREIDRDLQVGDIVFPIDARLNSSFETRVAELAYEYAFLRREDYELSASLGVHNLRFALDLSASRTASGQTRTFEQTAQANGPLPVFGLHGTWRLNDRFYVDGQAQFFKISLDPYAGRLEDYTASIVWTMIKHVGLGVGYNGFVTRVEVDADRFRGDLRWRYGGVRIFVTGSF